MSSAVDDFGLLGCMASFLLFSSRLEFATSDLTVESNDNKFLNVEPHPIFIAIGVSMHFFSSFFGTSLLHYKTPDNGSSSHSGVVNA